MFNGFSLTIWPRFVKFVKVSRCTVVMQVNLKPGSEEGELCTELSLITVLNCNIQRFDCHKVCAIKGPDLYPYKNEEICMALFHIRIFLYFHYTLHYFRWITSAWIICMLQWHLDWSVGQQMWATFNSGSDIHFGMRIYEAIKIILYTK